jgi:hypothetical protein
VITRKFTVILETLYNANYAGGKDCPEMVLTGLIRAIAGGIQKSPVFLFTDGVEKKNETFEPSSNLIQRKQTIVNFFVTGKCHIDFPNSKEFKNIAIISGGQVFLYPQKTAEVR